jgi:NDP-sugar pyrophosphorylase family protein
MYALIIAGGEGERLRPLTSDRPKAMIPVAGRPIIEHQLDWLRAGGVTNAVILCGYRADVLKDHIGDGQQFGVSVEYSIEAEPLGCGGALRRGYGSLPSGERLVIGCNGDILTNLPLDEIIQYHERKHAVATLMLTSLQALSASSMWSATGDQRVPREPDLPTGSTLASTSSPRVL